MSMDVTAVGLGGAGGRIVDALADLSEAGWGVAVIDTDAKALKESKARVKVEIGSGCAKGMGTGGNAELGNRAAMEDVEMIRSLFSEVKLAFVTVGLGGGAGMGAAPVALEAARDAGAICVCVATLPFRFEGSERGARAEQALKRIAQVADLTWEAPLDRLSASTGTENFGECLREADGLLASGIFSMEKMITHPGAMSLGYADFRQLTGSGKGGWTLGFGRGKGTGKAKEAMSSLLSSPLLNGGRALSEAATLLVSIMGGPDMTLHEVNELMAAISGERKLGLGLRVGTVVDDRYRDSIMVTVIASAGESGGAAPAPLQPDWDDVFGPMSAPPIHRGKKKMQQRQFDLYDQGRFKGVEPTIWEGENLDTPTYLRRNMSLPK